MATPLNVDQILTVDEFERLLNRGRGKAIVYLQTHDAAPYREVIRYVALTDVTDESFQAENGRSHYLMDLITLSGQEEAICEAAIQALHAQIKVTNDFYQLFDLLAAYARKGYQQAHQALYAWCRAYYDPYQPQGFAMKPLLELDGASAFLFLLDPLDSGRYPEITNENIYAFSRALDVLEEKKGVEETQKALYALTVSLPALRETIDTLYTLYALYLKSIIPTPSTDKTVVFPSTLSYAELREKADTENWWQPNHIVEQFKKWGEQASQTDLLEAATDFITLDLTWDQRWCFAFIFQSKGFPLNDLSRLFEMIYQSKNQPLDGSILRIFAHTHHPDVRAFALKCLSDPQYIFQALELLTSNFEATDWGLIALSFDFDLGDYLVHDLGFSVQELFRKYPSLDAPPCLIRLFESNPCALCREGVVKSLVSLNALPDWMADECRYDSSPDLRAYAERGFVDDPDD